MLNAWFVSDIHLKSINERNSHKLLRFLHYLENQKVTHLFLLGDIFDLWLGNSEISHAEFEPIVSSIIRIKQKGVDVRYFEGNHDLHLQQFWQNKFSIPVYTEHENFDLGHWKVRLEHGDLINQQDKSYLKLRSFLRHPKTESVLLKIPDQVVALIGHTASQLSRKFSSERRKQDADKIEGMIRSHAMAMCREDDFDYIITGHMHVRDEYSFQHNEKKVTSVNLGSWFEETKALNLTDSGHRFVDVDSL